MHTSYNFSFLVTRNYILYVLQDSKKKVCFGDIEIHDQSPLRSVGGNLHNEYMEYESRVKLYKGVVGSKQKLCKNGDFIAYIGEQSVCYSYCKAN